MKKRQLFTLSTIKDKIIGFFNPKLVNKSIKPKKGKKHVLFYNPTPKRAFIFGFGSMLFIGSIVYLGYIYYPLGRAYYEYKFTSRSPKTQEEINEIISDPTFKDVMENQIDFEDFYIYVPKIDASARVYPNVTAINKETYLPVLQKGVAHLKGSSFPNEGESIFLFAHSTNSPFNAIRYNAVFMLLNELINNDQIIIFFNGEKYIYNVFDKKIVNSDSVEYLNWTNDKETLILQTCWPPGTTWKRLLIFANPE
jgi:LPXTG-site transpeptidase (sortase) family protein